MFETPGFTGSHTTRILAKTGAGRLVHDTDFCSRMRFRADESERTKQKKMFFYNSDSETCRRYIHDIFRGPKVPRKRWHGRIPTLDGVGGGSGVGTD